MLETSVCFYSYANETTDKEEVIKKLVTGDNAPINKVYKPEFVTLAPPLLNCQDEVSIALIKVLICYWKYFILNYVFLPKIYISVCINLLEIDLKNLSFLKL